MLSAAIPEAGPPRTSSLTYVKVFETLSKKVDPKIEDERTKLMNERIRAEYEAAQRRLEELVSLYPRCWCKFS